MSRRTPFSFPMRSTPLLAGLAVVMAGLGHTGANAQSAADNAKRCQDLEASVQTSYQESVKRVLPTESPTQSVERSHNVRDILSTDVSGWFSKLSSLNWGSIMTTLLDKGLQKAADRATDSFNVRMNEMLSKNGIADVRFSGVNVNTGNLSSGGSPVTGGTVSGKVGGSNPYVTVGGSVGAGSGTGSVSVDLPGQRVTIPVQGASVSAAGQARPQQAAPQGGQQRNVFSK